MKRLVVSVLMMTLTIAAVMMAMMPSAKSETIIFSAQMLAANEVQAGTAVNPTESNTSGQAVVTLDTTVSGGVITAATARFDVVLNNLSPSSVLILSHIHEGGPTVAGPVRVDSGLTPGAPIPAAGGSVSFTRSNLTVSPALAASIIANPGGFYFNSHTALSPGGVARGQLVRLQQTTGVAAPTLSEWGAILMTLLFIAVGAFFLAGQTKTAEAIAGGGGSVVFGDAARVIDWKLLARVALYVEVVIALLMVAFRPGLLNVMGSLTAGLVISFIVHLFIRSARHT